jgi:two-component system chemotaxis response regulator CheB
MAGIRVLIVDDSVVIRKVLGEALASDPEIEVVGGAADGSIALAKIPLLKPDLITLDVEMPGMTGLETLIAIRRVQPKLPVIMFSTLTERGAAITLEALALGASDYLTKPNTGSLEQTRLRIRQELIPKVKELCKRRMGAKSVPGPQLEPAKVPIAKRNLPPARVDVVTIGSSTGDCFAGAYRTISCSDCHDSAYAPAVHPVAG